MRRGKLKRKSQRKNSKFWFYDFYLWGGDHELLLNMYMNCSIS